MEQQNYNQEQTSAPPVTMSGPYYNQPRKRVPWPWILLGVVLLVVILGFCGVFSGSDDADTVYYNEPHIARIFVEGTIASAYSGDYDHSFLLNTIDDLIYDPENVALIVYADTPGGELLASDELAQKILEYKQSTGRPVYVYGHNTMASGGYWIACAGDWVTANRYCITGSIGVTYGSMIDLSGFLERYGIRVNTIDSGLQKSMGSPLEEMTDETRAILQGIIDEYYGYFVDWVSVSRGIAVDDVIAMADGRIYSATQALDLGLIDQVGTYDDTLMALYDELGAYYPVQDYFSSSSLSIFDQLELLIESQGGEASAILELLPPSGPLAYYQGM